MNARLLVKTLHRPVSVPAPRAPAPPAAAEPLQLLGDGLDALFLRMQPDVIQPSADQRLLRYLRAKHAHPGDLDVRVDSLRRELGQAFQLAWARGQRPDLRFGRPMRLRTHSPRRTS